MHLQTHTFVHTYSAGQVGAVVGQMAFHLDPRKAEARVQLIGFQRVNEKGNRKMESDRQRGKEQKERRTKETARGGRELAKKSLWTPLCFPFLQPLAGRRSPSLSLCGPKLRVIPKQSALIQGARGLEHSAARLPEHPHPGLY